MTDLGTQWRQFEGKALFAYQRLVTRTTRWTFTGKANLTQARANGRPVLWTMWHGQVMPFLVYGDRFLDPNRFCIITVGDDRGDTLATLGDEMGAKMYKVDMQGNPVAAGRAVLRVIQAMKQGNDSMIAPDGPDGPAHEPKGGVAMLAKKSGAAVMPIGLWTRQAYQRKRWDGYLVPYPFAHIHVAYGPPIFAKRSAPTDELLAQISEALHVVSAQARQSAGVD